MINLNCISKTRLQILIFTLLTVINAFTFKYNAIAIAIGALELLVVIYNLLVRKFEKAFLLIIYFLSTVIENAYFATGIRSDDYRIYSFHTLPIIRTYHILALIGIIYVMTALRQKNNPINKMSKRLIFLWIGMFFVTLFSLAINNNSIREIWGLTRLVIVDGYNAFLTVGLFVICLRLINNNADFSKELHTTIISILKGVVIAAVIILFLGGKRRTESGDIYLICPLMLYWSPALILFYKSEKKINYIVYALLSVIIQIKYTVGIPGAWWLSTGIILISFVASIIRDITFLRKNKFAFVFTLLLAIFAVAGLFIILSSYKSGGSSSYIIYKLSTAISIFSLTSDPMMWLRGLGLSVGMRVEEIANIFIEYYKSPLYLFTGKGFGGTVLHYWGVFWWGTFGVFSDVQNAAQVYSVFHTGAAEMIINFGIVGIVFVAKWIKNVILAIFGKKYNPWLLIGSLYLLLFYSYYWSMAVCIVIFAYGVLSKENEKNEVLKNTTPSNISVVDVVSRKE